MTGKKFPWEEKEPLNGCFETPLKIIIDASNGASDYGNKFGEPVIGGFFRSFGKIFNENRMYTYDLYILVDISEVISMCNSARSTKINRDMLILFLPELTFH